MKNLFIIDGASGTGKSDLLDYIADYHADTSIVRKYTTRKERGYEQGERYKLDLAFVSEEEFENLGPEYHYLYSGHKYGFHRSSLNSALKSCSNVFVIVRSSALINTLVHDYSFLNVVPVYIYTDKVEIENRLREEGFDSSSVEFRLRRLKVAFDDYLRHPQIYREILINNSSIGDYHRLIDEMLKKYQAQPDVDHKLVFVLMSFSPENKQLTDYYRAMQRAVKSFDPSYTCVNLDEFSGSFKISDTAKKEIRNCRLAIVDLTENKPSVYYELGFVHGIGKDFVITAHESTEKLFYPGEYRIIYYENASELEEKLHEQVRAILEPTI